MSYGTICFIPSQLHPNPICSVQNKPFAPNRWPEKIKLHALVVHPVASVTGDGPVAWSLLAISKVPQQSRRELAAEASELLLMFAKNIKPTVIDSPQSSAR